MSFICILHVCRISMSAVTLHVSEETRYMLMWRALCQAGGDSMCRTRVPRLKVKHECACVSIQRTLAFVIQSQRLWPSFNPTTQVYHTALKGQYTQN